MTFRDNRPYLSGESYKAEEMKKRLKARVKEYMKCGIKVGIKKEVYNEVTDFIEDLLIQYTEILNEMNDDRIVKEWEKIQDEMNDDEYKKLSRKQITLDLATKARHELTRRWVSQHIM